MGAFSRTGDLAVCSMPLEASLPNHSVIVPRKVLDLRCQQRGLRRGAHPRRRPLNRVLRGQP
ncbi:hypothetical protein FK521_27445 [Klebsiella pneumoniae]|nr:hypothetical protein [Klebsiella pneumoniae]